MFACAQLWDNGMCAIPRKRLSHRTILSSNNKPQISLCPPECPMSRPASCFETSSPLHFTLRGFSIRALLKSDSVTQGFITTGGLFSSFSHFSTDLMPVPVNWSTPHPCFPHAEHLSVQLLVFMAGFTGVILQENKSQSPVHTG